MIKQEQFKEFSSARLITVLTPDTFLRRMIVVSTLMASEKGEGETAIAYAKALNSTCIDFNTLEYKVLKKHKSVADAQKYHFEVVNKKKFTDCPHEAF